MKKFFVSIFVFVCVLSCSELAMNNPYDELVAIKSTTTTISYTIEFDANGGVGTMSSLNAKTDVDVYLPNATFTPPTGMKFNGWNTGTQGNGVKYNGDSVAKNLTNKPGATVVLYAQWIATGWYNIIYKNVEGVNNLANPIIFSSASGVCLEDISKSDSEFVGWFDASTDGNQIKGWNAGEYQSDITLWARWKKLKINYMEVNNDENLNNPLTFTSKQTIILESAKKVGYNFDGWYDQSTDGNKISGWRPGEQTDDVTLWARWIPIKYYVRFHANGGLGSMDIQTIEYGKRTKLRSLGFTKENYIAYKYNDLSDGSGFSYALNEELYNLFDVDGAILDLYVIWNNTPSVGDIIYDDGMIASGVIAEKKPIGVIFKGGATGLFINLYNSSSSYRPDGAKTWCESVTAGGKSWRMPTETELTVLYSNITTVNNTLSKISSSYTTSFLGCTVSQVTTVWSSTVNGSYNYRLDGKNGVIETYNQGPTFITRAVTTY